MAYPERGSRRTGRWVEIGAALCAVAALSCGVLPRAGAIRPGASDAAPAGELVERFKEEGVRWIRTERDLHRTNGVRISAVDRHRLAAYFPQDLLDRARVVTVEGFENPDFFSLFAEHGEPNPLDLRRARALALVDTILVARASSQGAQRGRLLFHELVHLMQYEVLGLEEYMAGYVESWAENGRRYRDISHEEQAFELAGRFASGEGPFSVEDEVRSRFTSEDSEGFDQLSALASDPPRGALR